MKVVAYNIKDFERELLAIANQKVHDLTLISNALNFNTIQYVFGKEVVVVSAQDELNALLIDKLYQFGVRKIITRSFTTDHIDLLKAYSLDMQVANTPLLDQTAKGIAEQTMRSLNLWGKGRCLGAARCWAKNCMNSVNNKTHWYDGK